MAPLTKFHKIRPRAALRSCISKVSLQIFKEKAEGHVVGGEK